MFEFKCDREIQILDLYQNQRYESVAIEFYDDIIILENLHDIQFKDTYFVFDNMKYNYCDIQLIQGYNYA